MLVFFFFVNAIHRLACRLALFSNKFTPSNSCCCVIFVKSFRWRRDTTNTHSTESVCTQSNIRNLYAEKKNLIIIIMWSQFVASPFCYEWSSFIALHCMPFAHRYTTSCCCCLFFVSLIIPISLFFFLFCSVLLIRSCWIKDTLKYEHVYVQSTQIVPSLLFQFNKFDQSILISNATSMNIFEQRRMMSCDVLIDANVHDF